MVVLACAAGCTQSFGLDSARDDDRDGDHILDGSDNCPDVYNPDQSNHDLDPRGDACQVCSATDQTDSDSDGIPDACDACDNRLADDNHNGVPDACENPHDEDGDRVPDLFDNCPSVANQDQADGNDVGPGDGFTMPDGVGDDCDDSPGTDSQLFDSFVERNQLWLTDGSGWQDGDDHTIVPLLAGGASRTTGFAYFTFEVSTRVTLTGNGAAGVWGQDGDTASALQLQCVIFQSEGQPGALVMNATITGNGGSTTQSQQVPYTPTGKDLVQMQVEDMGAKQLITCSAPGVTPLQLTVASSVPVWHPGLLGIGDGAPTSTAQFEYFDLVTTRL
jgi:thrombospondin type 3 repeat protein